MSESYDYCIRWSRDAAGTDQCAQWSAAAQRAPAAQPQSFRATTSQPAPIALSYQNVVPGLDYISTQLLAVVVGLGCIWAGNALGNRMNRPILGKALGFAVGLYLIYSAGLLVP